MSFYVVRAVSYSGEDTGEVAARVAADIAATVTPPKEVLISLGTNNINASQPTFEADYATILDSMHAAWPTTRIFLTRSWRSGYDVGADTHAAAIAAVIATRGGFAFEGPDERVLLKGADNGICCTIDGIHANAVGSAALAADWFTRLGY